MGLDLVGKLKEIDNKLKTLEVGKVLDISDLSEDEAKVIGLLYSKEYFMKGPLKDKDNKGKYVLAFMINYEGEENV